MLIDRAILGTIGLIERSTLRWYAPGPACRHDPPGADPRPLRSRVGRGGGPAPRDAVPGEAARHLRRSHARRAGPRLRARSSRCARLPPDRMQRKRRPISCFRRTFRATWKNGCSRCARTATSTLPTGERWDPASSWLVLPISWPVPTVSIPDGRYARLAESLHPGVRSLEAFRLWLTRSPVKPSRFLPMLRERRRQRLTSVVS